MWQVSSVSRTSCRTLRRWCEDPRRLPTVMLPRYSPQHDRRPTPELRFLVGSPSRMHVGSEEFVVVELTVLVYIVRLPHELSERRGT